MDFFEKNVKKVIIFSLRLLDNKIKKNKVWNSFLFLSNPTPGTALLY